MKRRAIVAVLVALALVAVAVELGNSGESSQGYAEATEGKPFTGKSGVTRSVAWIQARQRFENRHPEAPTADQDADAEAAAAGEEAARESTEPGAESSGPSVREKPEPGEEGTPPRVAGPAVRLQRTGPSAIGPRSSLSTGTSFLGANLSQSDFVPPDSMGSVGPDQILVSVNGTIRVYDKDGTPGGLHVTDKSFWTPVRDGEDVTDPGVEFDRLSQRWIVTAVNLAATDNLMMVAVSNGPTITDATSFTFFSFHESDPLPPGASHFADYPQLAVDANAIYLGLNDFTSLSGSFAGTTAYVVQKASVICPTPPCGPIHVTGFRTVSSSFGSGPDSPQPATDMDPTVGEGYFVGPDNLVANRLDIRKISDPGSLTPSISSTSLTVPSTAQPLAVPAQGTSGGLDAIDDRLFEAMIARGPDGTDSLWTAHNIRVNSSGVGSGSGDRDGARWYQIGDLSSTPSLTQSGTLFDTATSNPRFFWMPSIAMNGQGHASLNTSTAGNGRFAEVASSGRLAFQPLGTTEKFDLTQSSSSSYNIGQDSPRRWGDYSQTVVDPTDDQTFWTFQEYANANQSWGVRVIQLKAPPPAVPETASPNTVPIDASPHSVEITGTAPDGAGFFDPTDPGTPYPDYDHIAATVSNDVVVNSVTVTNRAHLTLDLDTSAATPGYASITITNPDGQSSTCSHALIVDSDSTVPATPTPTETKPASPGNDASPLVSGSDAECGSRVDLFTDPDCTGPLAGTNTATTFDSPGIGVSVPENLTTTFYAMATSVAGDESLCSPTGLPYTEDSIPPQVIVNTGPAGTTSDSTPTFTFSATDAVGPITFKCSIDSGTPSFGACSGPGHSDTPASALADGSHTFRVQATDGASNSAVATRAFTVKAPTPAPPPPTPTPVNPAEPIAPETTITKGPKKTRKRRPKFKFTSDQAGSSFQCRLDKGKFRPCTSPFRPPKKLKPGKHKLKVSAIGPTGLVDSAPAVRKFKILP